MNQVQFTRNGEGYKHGNEIYRYNLQKNKDNLQKDQRKVNIFEKTGIIYKKTEQGSQTKPEKFKDIAKITIGFVLFTHLLWINTGTN
jgi:hypothetical protein